MKWFWNWVILTASSPPDFSREESKQYATKRNRLTCLNLLVFLIAATQPRTPCQQQFVSGDIRDTLNRV
jgi:hypothetical protein